MRETIDVWPEEPSESGGCVEAAVRLEHRGDSHRLWWRVPARLRLALSSDQDSAAIITTFLGMAMKADVCVHGRVSPSLLGNLEEFAAIWSRWRRGRYYPVSIRSDEAEESPRSPGGAIMGFSGGVDSCHTLYRHTNGLADQGAVACVMVHGFDIPLEESGGFSAAFARMSRLTRSAGADLIPMSTNIRSLRMKWSDVFSAALASCLCLFKSSYSRALIAGSVARSIIRFPVAGVNTLTDHLLSSDSFEVVHDGAESDRMEKIAAIGRWDEARELLRVCWQGGQRDGNCGRCEKCIRTYYSFLLSGFSPPAAFSTAPSPGDIERALVYGIQLGMMKGLLGKAAAAGLAEEPWALAMRKCIARSRRWNALKRLTQVFQELGFSGLARSKAGPWR